MKIGFVLDDSLDKADGVQQYVLTLGKWFSSQGHQVHYLVGHTERTDVPHIHSLSRNIQVHFNQNRMSTPLPTKTDRLKALLAEHDFDVLHVQLPYSPFLAGRIVRLAPAHTAVIGTFHIIPFSRVEKLASRVLRLMIRRSLKRFDEVFSVSEPARRFAKKTFKVHSTVLPNVVAVQHFQAGRKLRRYDDGKLNMVFLGRLVERKGCLHFLKALQQLHDQHHLDRVRVLVIGKGPLKSKLEKFVTTNHLKQYVKFVGFIEEEKKPDYLASADIAVFPSTGGESFGIVLIEAMAAGSDVVLAGDNSGYAAVMAGHSEQLFDPEDTAEFVRRLKHFMNNHRARRQAAAWQAESVVQYDVRQVGHQLLDAYETAIAKRV